MIWVIIKSTLGEYMGDILEENLIDNIYKFEHSADYYFRHNGPKLSAYIVRELINAPNFLQTPPGLFIVKL